MVGFFSLPPHAQISERKEKTAKDLSIAMPAFRKCGRRKALDFQGRPRIATAFWRRKAQPLKIDNMYGGMYVH